MNTSLHLARRIGILTVVAAVFSMLAYGAGWAVRGDALPWEDSPRASGAARDLPPGTPAADATDDAPAPEPSGTPRGEASEDSDTAPKPTEDPSGNPDGSPEPDAEDTAPEPTEDPGPPPAGPALLSPGDDGPEVRELQARLKQIDWFSGDVTDHYGDVTKAAVSGFQAKRGIEVTGAVDQRTLDLLHGMTREPTKDELTNQPPPGDNGNKPGALDARCTTGRVLCIDKTSRTLRWVVDGDVRKTVDVRFGSSELPTREGVFSVGRKSRDHVSSLYHTPMPYAMFFSGGQAVHFSPDFLAHGYNGASHGCVNVRDKEAVAWLFDQVALGDKVVIYWS